jgi:hypothetical protein
MKKTVPSLQTEPPSLTTLAIVQQFRVSDFAEFLGGESTLLPNVLRQVILKKSNPRTLALSNR